jgi:Ca-activated chloride channel homolog
VLSLNSPLPFLALPILLAWVWWLSRRSYAHLSPAARIGSSALRILILVLLLAALAKPLLHKSTRGQHIIFLLDASRSISAENIEAALADIDRLAAAIPAGHRLSLIAFGHHPRILINAAGSWSGWQEALRELPLYESTLPTLQSQRARLLVESAPAERLEEITRRIAALEHFRDHVAGDHTDLASALRLALSLGAINEAKTLYLFTDGNITRAQGASEYRHLLSQLATANHTLHTVSLDRPIPSEIAAVDLTLPQSIRVNQGFTADLRIASTVETQARLTVFLDGFKTAEIPAALRPGQNTISIPGLYFRAKGFHTVEVTIRAEPPHHDTRLENNTVRALATVPGELRILYIDSDEAQQSYLSSALALEGINVDSRPASGIPQNLGELLGYDALLLSNVPADRLSARQMQAIRSYVQDFGGGFIMLGGDQSFGLGGYYATPIEEILPVRMPIQKDLNRPSLAIILVIDKSGSMDGVKMQLAKRAAIATAEAINPRDQIAVVGFDSDAQIILELTSAGDRGTINAQIASLEAGGGTFLYPGLEIAQDQLQQSNARRKHIIILSDGQTQGFGYGDLAGMMAAEGITISTVGIGEGADMRLMEEIALNGSGRAYFTNDFYSIPQIFTREALRASNSMLVERLVIPTAIADDESLREIDDEDLPPLGGYVATTPKETAKVILISETGDPLLARWRYGLGRTVAFTSDTKPRWAEDWIRWPDFAKFWAQLIRSTAGSAVNQAIAIDPAIESLDADHIRLVADLGTAGGDFVTDRPLELTMADAGGTRPLSVEREAPGLFSASIPRAAYGQAQQFAWTLPGSDLVAPYGYILSFSPEFRTLGPDDQTLSDIAAAARAAPPLSVGQPTLALTTRRGTTQIPLWPYLLIAAIVLAPLDILRRRIN